jgi:glutamate--cysteine ligase
MLTYDDLVNDMAAGCKPKADWRVGIEHEQFLYHKTDRKPLPYDGKPGIKQVLERLSQRYGWTPKTANGHLIALEKDGHNISLEPGGQFEFSSAPLKTAADVRREADAFYHSLRAVADSLDIGILDAGFHPHWRREDIKRMPKERYAIMAPYMETVGQHGIDMMLRTCGVQVNLDFESEADMVKKYRVALGLQPVMTALLANSSMVEGAETPYKSYRSHIWTDTDPARCGVPPFVFEDGMGFARYADWALDVPMYFIIRDGHYIDVAGQSFRAFIDGRLKGHEGVYPAIEDWRDHLTTLFPEVRLKTYLELRGMDSVAPPLVYAMTAFWTAIVYDADALDQAWDLIRDWPVEAHLRLRQEVPKEGLETLLHHGQHLRNLALEAIEIADRSLIRTDDAAAREDLRLLLDKARMP